MSMKHAEAVETTVEPRDVLSRSVNGGGLARLKKDMWLYILLLPGLIYFSSLSICRCGRDDRLSKLQSLSRIRK